jgi:hypothetical protein
MRAPDLDRSNLTDADGSRPSEISSSKFQIPNNLKNPKEKRRTNTIKAWIWRFWDLERRFRFESLALVWDLEFGIWSFGAPL